ncbi:MULTISPECIES: hypothetical protein [Serratia]|uniref:Uncharacterized protein n=1 Tax=Serratia entomophila TaxID=42906 RepID=A0ABY5CSC7_9GAMM|nr:MULTISPECIES: hypothetical protein [Serratia]KAB1493893.1 hypothetical protein F8R23_21745 [Serratia proteamaculans]MBI6139364.1 hypothetical protein [Serratia plymuthica]NIC27718.1 hypothetical protein [Serratia plymuthica]QPS85974.1 hypothetical protein I6G46_17605 [Serratia plymuthica]USV01064.1 hypothetical protein KFQ06_00420 [Serratia entomophila]
MKIKNKLGIVMWVISVVAAVNIAWQRTTQDPAFECRARIHSKLLADKCDRNSVFDVFLAMHANGRGYWLISGTSVCPNSPQTLTNGIVEFTYKKEGGYFSMHMDKRSSDITEVFSALRYDDLKMKITRVNTWDYALSLTNQTLMICTED